MIYTTEQQLLAHKVTNILRHMSVIRHALFSKINVTLIKIKITAFLPINIIPRNRMTKKGLSDFKGNCLKWGFMFDYVASNTTHISGVSIKNIESIP